MEPSDPLFWPIALFLAALSIVAIRIGFNFDINKHIETRHERRKEKLRMLCPHAQMVKKNGGFALISSYGSPPGTNKWICDTCGVETFGPDPFDRTMKIYQKNPELFMRNEKDFLKYANKFHKL